LEKIMVFRVIAIDGPAASGKSTVAELLAKELKFLFFDTGIMYRAVTWAALHHKIAIADETGVTQLAERVRIDVLPPSKNDGRTSDVLLDDRDITWQIREKEVDANVSQVSTYAGVRTAMTEQQRRIGQRGAVVMVGRDIGTVVCPQADLKVFLIASAEERARRRYDEVIKRGGQADFNEILTSIKRRDEIDSNRVVAPLKPADDAVIVDTDNRTIEQVFQEIKRLVK
jgi:cytidylate kinase